jgi:hypothetical protein
MKMRRFEKGGFATSEDSEANADRLGDFIATLDRGPVAAPSYGRTLAERQTPSNKPLVVTKEELAKSGMSLRDYMNEKQGLTRRKDKVNPTLGEAKDKNAQDAADAIDPGDTRTREIGKTRGGPSYDNAGKPSNAGPDVEYKPQSLNKRTGATAKMMSDFNNQANKRTGRGYASGGSVSASSRGDGIAQRGKTRGKMC